MEKILISELSSKVKSSVNTVVLVSAEWCGQCKMTKILIDKISLDYPSILFVEMDADGDKIWDMEEFQVTQVPTFLFYKGGELAKNVSGYQYEEVLRDLLNTL